MAKLVSVPVPPAPRAEALGPIAARFCPAFAPVLPPRPRSRSPPANVSVPAVGSVLGGSERAGGAGGAAGGSVLATGDGVGSGDGAGVGTTLVLRCGTSACLTAARARCTGLTGVAGGGGGSAVTNSTVTSFAGARAVVTGPSAATPTRASTCKATDPASGEGTRPPRIAINGDPGAVRRSLASRCRRSARRPWRRPPADG